MKPLFLALFSLSLSLAAVAGDLPQVQAPSELAAGEFAEGTLTKLSADEVKEFLPWAQNARNQLQRAQRQAQSMPLRDRLPHIQRVVKIVVARSGNRQYQALMRFALNRGLLLVDELEKNTNMNDVGAQENALDILQRSIAVGLSFYESDLTFQQRAQSGQATTVIPYAAFGSTFMQNLYPGIVNVLDATAQYRLLYKLIEMVNWDLSRDANAPRYAEAIVEAFEMGQDLPEVPERDDKANLRMIRRLNSLRIIALSVGAQSIQNNNEADGVVIAVTPVQSVESNSSSRPEIGIVRCETTSMGKNFVKVSRDIYESRSGVIAQCTNDRSTNNDLCEANVTCSDRPAPALFACKAQSNDNIFKVLTRKASVGRATALANCKADRSTNNDECEASVTCEGDRDWGNLAICTTRSNSIDFSFVARDPKVAALGAISKCEADRRTDNSQCNASYSCR